MQVVSRRAYMKHLVVSYISVWLFHPQIDGQLECTIQTLEDMLWACALDFGGKWDEHLPLVEFAYNNSYQATIGMPPYATF